MHFQRRTAEHVFRRLYLDAARARRFLIADEVGLGKTVVARGLVAKAIHHLQDQVARVDVVYVCSNAAIAAQNVQRLNLQADEQTTLATRLTLLPMQMRSLRQNKVNFVSFTPATTFDLRSRGGTREERALLYRLLESGLGLGEAGLRNMLQLNVSSPERWAACIEACEPKAIDADLAQQFRARLAALPLRGKLEEACGAFARRRENYAREHQTLRLEVIGGLRQALASTCIDALEPDLIILDEFQRFRDLLHGEHDAASLAQQLFAYGDARVVLLSATPYRLLSLAHEQDEDHHRDFLETVRFLAEGTSLSVDSLAASLGALRQSLLQTSPEQHERVRRARGEVEGMLRSVMCRTERVASTRARDAMIREVRLPAPLEAADVAQAVAVDRISRVLGADDPVEYWKSAPYLLSFMEGYELKRRLGDELEAGDEATLGALRDNAPFMLTKQQFASYQQLAPQNGRMRVLAEETIETGNWRLLWLPPAVPYIEPSGPYAGLAPAAATKALIFSAWRVVPKAIAVLLSYEAERRMLGVQAEGASYEGLGRKHRPLLTFAVRGKQPQGMTTLALVYPCATLASHVDPLALALDLGEHGAASLETFRSHIAQKVRPLVDRLVARFGSGQEGAVDQRWYWAALVLLDAQHHSSVLDWVDDPEGFQGLFGEEGEGTAADSGEDEDAGGFERHVEELLRVARGGEKLGRVPDDLGQVIADFALASPAICAVRAILRVSRLSAAWDPHVLGPAARVARGFRTLFNVPESLVLLRGEDDSKAYWRRVLEYCVDGNLQAVLDEYAHLLVGSEGCIGAAPARIAERVSGAMLEALSPRTVNLAVDEVQVRGKEVRIEPFRVRCRYALRFGDQGDEDQDAVERAKTTREAFNSPFRPFVLASTSVGQEGLDFHHYCHAVYHWNLPTNPVDLEQREGRVHRYKGHAIRRNIAMRFGLEALRTRWSGEGDPWERLFELAAAERPLGATELLPYWVFETEGGVTVERRVPLLPLSREVGQLEVLRKQLAVYRLAFGQPRQEDLVAYLSSQGLSAEQIDGWRICLEPPVLDSEL